MNIYLKMLCTWIFKKALEKSQKYVIWNSSNDMEIT